MLLFGQSSGICTDGSTMIPTESPRLGRGASWRIGAGSQLAFGNGWKPRQVPSHITERMLELRNLLAVSQLLVEQVQECGFRAGELLSDVVVVRSARIAAEVRSPAARQWPLRHDLRTPRIEARGSLTEPESATWPVPIHAQPRSRRRASGKFTIRPYVVTSIIVTTGNSRCIISITSN